MPTPEETAAQLEAARKALADAEVAHAAAVEAAPPRSFEEIIYDFFANLVMRTGHHPELQRLLDELKRALHLEQPPAPAQAADEIMVA
jgi:hypothetical protein